MNNFSYNNLKHLFDNCNRGFVEVVENQGILPYFENTDMFSEESILPLSDVKRTTLRRHILTLHVHGSMVLNKSVNSLPFSSIIPIVNSIFEAENNGVEDDGTQRRLYLANIREERQVEIDGFVFFFVFYATSSRLVDSVGRAVVERVLHGVLTGKKPDDIVQEVRYNPPCISFEEKYYKEDAEEVAHELLKSMISKKEFETYKKFDYVIVKGTKGREYKVKKQEMIEVTQQKKGVRGKYRLCIEPEKRGTICPTDEVIAKIKLIKANEAFLHKVGNIFNDNDLSECVTSEGTIGVPFNFM